MKWLIHYLNARGLRAGIYTDAGPDGCYGQNAGSYKHIRQDVNTFAAWGFVAVKVDFCSGSRTGRDPASIYADFGRAIAHNSSGRKMIFVICDGLPPLDSWQYGPAIAQGWRTGFDISLDGSLSPWNGVFSVGQWRYGSVLSNLDADAAHANLAGPGHWNDPDYLQAGAPTLSATEQQSQFTMWAMLAAPLVIGRDLTTFSQATRAMLQNAEVIAVDQDALGVQAIEVSDRHGLQIWSKRLKRADSRAVALLNRTSRSAAITVTLREIGLDGPGQIRDLWRHRNLGSYADRYTAIVPSHATALVEVHMGRR